MKLLNPKIAAIAAGFICLSILGGALGAHGLRDTLEPKQLDAFKTAMDYLMYQGLGLLFLSLIELSNPRVVYGIIVGSLLFSGSIVLFIFTSLTDQLPILGLITPIGGLMLIGMWGGLALQWIYERKK